jgi:hypothetical protein
LGISRNASLEIANINVDKAIPKTQVVSLRKRSASKGGKQRGDLAEL